MSSDKFQIKINSILGGHTQTTHFASEDQFLASVGIDPAQVATNVNMATGLICPMAAESFSSATITDVPMWIVPTPKDTIIYIYSANGSAYAVPTNAFSSVSELGDLNDGGSASGNGCAYYDNYVYFSRDTTVARYGPLNGTPSFADDYWVTTLGKTALENNQYPIHSFATLPNHILHRHSDGRLYIADVVGNTGTIHFIQTTKTTVEGDTDNGSTYDKLHVGYGLYPTAMESYGSDLVIAFVEGKWNASATNNPLFERAKIAFWDTISNDVNQITWVEFPDPIISAMKNVDGILYVFSGQEAQQGVRISRYIGGYTFEEVYYEEQGELPLAGAVDGDSKRLLFGGYYNNLESAVSVYSLGLAKGSISNGLFNVMSTPISGGTVSALKLVRRRGFFQNRPIIGWTTGSSGGGSNALAKESTNFDSSPCYWWSQVYKIGQYFKITKVIIPLESSVLANAQIKVSLLFDTISSETLIGTINNTNYPNSEKRIVLRPNSAVGQYNFVLKFEWSGIIALAVGLPITIEYELLDD